MTIFDLDRYYTPSTVANRMLERTDFSSKPSICADSACGSGNLLEAANSVFGASVFFGLDSDKRTIEQLRRRRPEWILSVGNLMIPKSYGASQVARSITDTNLLVLNPPFSQAKGKTVPVEFAQTAVRCSVAMAYLLRSLELFRPDLGAVAIVPESLLYSEVDSLARELLTKTHTVRILTELTTSTFRGTRAHAAVVQIGAAKRENLAATKRPPPASTKVELLRGALPVHSAVEAARGCLFVHSTNLRAISPTGDIPNCARTSSSAKGRVKGWVVLLPRVGVPAVSQIKAVHLHREAQLSDCVIAVICANRKSATTISRRIRSQFTTFLQLYKGTGARYVTMQRLHEWLRFNGISAECHLAH